MTAGEFVQNRIIEIEKNEQKQVILATIRKGIGKSMGTYPEVYQAIFRNYPGSEPLSQAQEEAIYFALTLYSFHKVGNIQHCMHKEEIHIASAIAGLGEKWSLDNLTRKMNAMLKTDDMDLLYRYLQGFVKPIGDCGQAFDYRKLADDLYYYHFPEKQESIRLKWNQAFVRGLNNASSEAEAVS